MKDEDLFDINLSKMQLFDLLSTVIDDTIEIKKKNKQLQTRIEKAIKYLNDKNIYDSEYGEFIYYQYLIHDNLIDILNGKEKENG